ncbi:PucR family transcriptional regulator [Desulfosporosinus fructosivorans]|uniref:PucR family transcriptional regulator n=1 Tax=Desulfosporosinus fructosivorans TaxID=2018669 RepID=A0A4Z0R8F9_9FIRM|nr:PucR family transcriptional regulator [Desulfosporosinus fructosivorans]TGE39118.1 PucR family transcriptional regulator [Desulfosporosinus fructosivorans]
MEITVKELMQLGPLKASQVVAGYQNLDNVVKGVTIMEAPDIVNWLSGGELLLTSLYSTSGGEVNYPEFIQKLSAKGVCALAVKVRRFVDDIPQEIIETANEVGLPIIELEGNVRFVDIMYPVMEMLFNKQVVELKYYKEVQERFTALALHCEGLESITTTLAELIGNPVAVFDKSRKCLHTTDEKINQFSEVTELYDRELLSDKFSFYRHMVVFPSCGEEPIPQVVVPIQALNQIKAYLTVAEINRPLQDMDFICLEHAATVVTLDRVKRFAVKEVEQKFRNDIIEHLISGEVEVNTLLERASLLEWDINRPFVVVLFNIKHIDAYLAEKKVQPDKLALQGIKSEIQTMITSLMKFQTRDFILGHKGDSIIVLWPVIENIEQLLQDIKKTGLEVQNLMKKRLKKISISMGIGDVAAEIQDIPQSYKEAQDAILFGEMLHGDNVISSFQELGVLRILCKFGERNALEEFVPRPLKKLYDHDQTNQGELLKSLKVFLECNGNASKAAKELFIHYKTLLYRLERIKDITELNLENNKNRLELELGLKIMLLLNQTSE